MFESVRVIMADVEKIADLRRDICFFHHFVVQSGCQRLSRFQRAAGQATSNLRQSRRRNPSASRTVMYFRAQSLLSPLAFRS